MTGNQKPLANKTALIACSAMKAARLAEGLAALGAHTVTLPVIQIRELPGALDPFLRRLSEYDWVIFTSGHGVQTFGEQMRRLDLDPDQCRAAICAIGPATAEAVRRNGMHVNLIPSDFVAEGVLAALHERTHGPTGLAGLRILMPRARIARDLLPDALMAAGARVDSVACYENLLPDLSAGQMRSIVDHSPDLLVFTSSSTAANFIALAGDKGKEMILNAVVAALGPITARTVAGFGKHPEIIPSENTIPSLLAAIQSYFAQLHDKP